MDELYYGIQPWDFEDVKTDIKDFLKLYENRPIKNNLGGMTSTHLFWTWYVTKKLNPKYIIESGVYKGQGTWMFRQVCPKAQIFSIDPVLESRVYIDDTVTYFTEDFSTILWNKYLKPEETLCFFDDHQNAYTRLMQMKWMGFICAMFEDNYPAGQGDCYSMKKVFSQKGFIHNETVVVPENEAHSSYVKNNIETYTTFPPLYKNANTRWGDEWNDEKYLTELPIFQEFDKEKYPILAQEADGYTWICYVKLKESFDR